MMIMLFMYESPLDFLVRAAYILIMNSKDYTSKADLIKVAKLYIAIGTPVSKAIAREALGRAVTIGMGTYRLRLQ